jgi:chaperonin GroES
MLEPLNDRVLVRLVEGEEKTTGGIVLPDTAKEKPTKGVVEAVGPGRLLEDGSRLPIAVNKGDKVIFSKYGGTEFKEKNVAYMILREDDIYAMDVASAEKASKCAKPAKRKR